METHCVVFLGGARETTCGGDLREKHVDGWFVEAWTHLVHAVSI